MYFIHDIADKVTALKSRNFYNQLIYKVVAYVTFIPKPAVLTPNTIVKLYISFTVSFDTVV